jgi:hypothetical protein
MKQKKVTVTLAVYNRLARLADRSVRSIPNVIDALTADEDRALAVLIGCPLPAAPQDTTSDDEGLSEAMREGEDRPDTS